MQELWAGKPLLWNCKWKTEKDTGYKKIKKTSALVHAVDEQDCDIYEDINSLKAAESGKDGGKTK